MPITKVLLIDDDRQLAGTMASLLAKHGYELNWHDTGRDLPEPDVALVLLDVMLPERDGFEVCRAMRARGDRRPVIMLTGKGDPLAHPRMSIACRAQRLERGTPEHERAERRYLNRNPKASLYAGLGDFSIFRLEPQGASLNGGFGKAYVLERSDLLVEGSVTEALAASEQGALDHMNADHRDAIQAYAHHYAKARGDGWMLAGIDAEGMDLLAGDEARRVFFPQPLAAAQDLRKVLVEMARAARDAGAAVAGHEGNDHMGA